MILVIKSEEIAEAIRYALGYVNHGPLEDRFDTDGPVLVSKEELELIIEALQYLVTLDGFDEVDQRIHEVTLELIENYPSGVCYLKLPDDWDAGLPELKTVQ